MMRSQLARLVKLDMGREGERCEWTFWFLRKDRVRRLRT